LFFLLFSNLFPFLTLCSVFLFGYVNFSLDVLPCNIPFTIFLYIPSLFFSCIKSTSKFICSLLYEENMDLTIYGAPLVVLISIILPSFFSDDAIFTQPSKVHQQYYFPLSMSFRFTPVITPS